MNSRPASDPSPDATAGWSMSSEQRAANLERIREAIAHDAYDVPPLAVADAIVEFYARPSDSGAGGDASA